MFPHKAVEPAVNRNRPRSSKAQRKKASQIEEVSFISRLAEVRSSGIKRFKFDRTKSVWQMNRDDRDEEDEHHGNCC